MPGAEKRAAVRYDVSVAAEVYTKDQIVPAHTRNLSRSGVCLDLDRSLDEGAVVGVSLFLTADGIEDPDMEPLNIKAQVMWCTERDDSGFSAGARFDGLLPEHGSVLDRFLSALG